MIRNAEGVEVKSFMKKPYFVCLSLGHQLHLQGLGRDMTGWEPATLVFHRLQWGSMLGGLYRQLSRIEKDDGKCTDRF